MLGNLVLATDSGAFSLYNRSKAKKKEIDIDEYLEKYAEYCRSLPPTSFCATLDVLFDPKKTWVFFKKLQKLGVNTLPIIHYGTDESWIKKYMGETDYIGLGGLATNPSDRDRWRWLDHCWKVLMDSKKKPLCGVHGFGVTSFRNLTMFPWKSVDSTSFLQSGRFGCIVLPRCRAPGKYDFLCSPYVFPITPRRRLDYGHLLHKGSQTTKRVLEYLETLDLSLEDVIGAREGKDGRDLRFWVNMYFRLQQQKALNDQGLQVKIYSSGDWTLPGCFEKLGGWASGSDFHFLGSFYAKGFTQKVISSFNSYKRESKKK